jgi:hypothetical protein
MGGRPAPFGDGRGKSPGREMNIDVKGLKDL